MLRTYCRATSFAGLAPAARGSNVMADQIEIKAGDTVELQSGGRTMSVESVSEGVASCVWHDNNGAGHKMAIGLAALKLREAATGVHVV